MIRRTNRLKYNWSDKHIEYMRKTQHAAINIAEGSIRSGKTTDNIFCFAYDLKHSRDKIHLATASTQPTAKLVIGDCDGYGLEHIFRGQCTWGKYKGNECLKIKGVDTGYKEKIVLFCGGAKADSYKKFRGMSIGLWIATEINLHHEDTIREAQRRQINADIKRLYWDLNPGSPSDKIYTDFIDDWQKKADSGILKGGYNYQAFNIFDNVNLSKENLESELSKYTVGDVFYRRDILGERCVAEGLIYPMFANDPNKYIIKRENVPKLAYINIGVDFGGNKSNHAFVATGIDKTLTNVYVLKSWSLPATGKTVEYVDAMYDKFEKSVISEYGFVDNTFADSAEQTIINTMRTKHSKIYNSIKNPIIDRIRCTDLLISSGRFFIVDGDNDAIIKGLSTAVWDEKKLDDTRLDNGTSDIDILDAFEYSWEYYIKRLRRNKND